MLLIRLTPTRNRLTSQPISPLISPRKNRPIRPLPRRQELLQPPRPRALRWQARLAARGGSAAAVETPAGHRWLGIFNALKHAAADSGAAPAASPKSGPGAAPAVAPQAAPAAGDSPFGAPAAGPAKAAVPPAAVAPASRCSACRRACTSGNSIRLMPRRRKTRSATNRPRQRPNAAPPAAKATPDAKMPADKAARAEMKKDDDPFKI